MAAPIIRSAVATPDTVAPGTAFVVKIDAFDPDSRSARLAGKVTDSRGGTAEIDVTINLSDPLTYSLVDADEVGFKITPRSAEPGVFDVVAP